MKGPRITQEPVEWPALFRSAFFGVRRQNPLQRVATPLWTRVVAPAADKVCRLSLPRIPRIPRFPSLVLIVLSLALLLSVGCKEKRNPNAADFSRSNSVTVTLGDPDTEHGNGLEHVYWENDGLTIATNLDNMPCRQLKLEGIPVGYLYFIIDPTFKKSGIKRVKIEVEYFSDKPGEMGLQYDASKSRRTSAAAYPEFGLIVRLAGSRTWERATFPIQGATFRNSQNSHADFRFWVKPADVYVRRVTVTREK